MLSCYTHLLTNQNELNFVGSNRTVAGNSRCRLDTAISIWCGLSTGLRDWTRRKLYSSDFEAAHTLPHYSTLTSHELDRAPFGSCEGVGYSMWSLHYWFQESRVMKVSAFKFLSQHMHCVASSSLWKYAKQMELWEALVFEPDTLQGGRRRVWFWELEILWYI